MSIPWFGLFIYMLLAGTGEDLLPGSQHGFVENDGVKLHYVTIGHGPLVVMLHGYPDFWYTWRHQMQALSRDYQVVAVDLRGYNRSDKPRGVENYAMRLLIGDVAAVIRHFPQQKAIVVGHDWGGAIAWQAAIWRPELVEKLVVLSTPHPRGLFRELTHNPEQQKNSQYASDYQKPDAHKTLTAESLASWIKDEATRKIYIEAFERSDFEAMLNYYKASFPKQTTARPSPGPPAGPTPQIQCPVLAIFGLQDQALLAAGWNDTWEWIDRDLTLVSVPGAGHFIQQDASDFVTRTMITWLKK